MEITFLGTGDPAGIPAFNCDCPACSKARLNPDLARASTSLLITEGGTRLLVDAGNPEICRRFDGKKIDTILLTHYHVDHVTALFRLRWGAGSRIPVIGPDDPHGCADLFKHPGILDFQTKARPFVSFIVNGLEITPLPLNHSKITLGFFISSPQTSLAYLCDTVGLPSETSAFLKTRKPETLILDCTHPPTVENPRNHNNLTQALELIDTIGARHNHLTHISHQLIAWLAQSALTLPSHVNLAEEGKVLT